MPRDYPASLGTALRQAAGARPSENDFYEFTFDTSAAKLIDPFLATPLEDHPFWGPLSRSREVLVRMRTRVTGIPAVPEAGKPGQSHVLTLQELDNLLHDAEFLNGLRTLFSILIRLRNEMRSQEETLDDKKVGQWMQEASAQSLRRLLPLHDRAPSATSDQIVWCRIINEALGSLYLGAGLNQDRDRLRASIMASVLCGQRLRER